MSAAPAAAAVSCSSPGSPAFARWGDPVVYASVLGSTMESSNLWKLGGGASFAQENEPWRVCGSSDRQSLQVVAGATATSAASAQRLSGHVRFFVKSPGVAGATLRLRITVTTKGSRGGVIATSDFVVSGATAGWAPTPIFTIADYSGDWGVQTLTLAVSASGGGTWRVDDILLDPWKTR